MLTSATCVEARFGRRRRFRRLHLSLLLCVLVAPDVACASGSDEVSDLAGDEVAIIYESYARLDGEGRWVGTVRGKVFEPEEDDLLRNALIGMLEGALDVDGAEESARFAARARHFLVDNERGKRVVLVAGDTRAGAGSSRPDGLFEARIAVAAEPTLQAEGAGGEVALKAALEPGDRRSFGGTLRLIPPEGLTVICDVDDTVKVSDVHDEKALLRNTFLEEYRAVDGMPELLETYRRRGAVFHYVSNSPVQLYEPLKSFFRREKVPAGTLHLRPFRLKDRSFLDFLQKSDEHKLGTIEAILGDFPQRRFVLIGDTSERDPEIYGEIARRHSSQITRILLRDVSGEGPSPRIAEALKDLPAERWALFTDPGREAAAAAAAEEPTEEAERKEAVEAAAPPDSPDRS